MNDPDHSSVTDKGPKRDGQKSAFCVLVSAVKYSTFAASLVPFISPCRKAGSKNNSSLEHIGFCPVSRRQQQQEVAAGGGSLKDMLTFMHWELKCLSLPPPHQSTTLILWIPLIVVCVIQTVFSSRCSAVCLSFLGLLCCPLRRKSRNVGKSVRFRLSAAGHALLGQSDVSAPRNPV